MNILRLKNFEFNASELINNGSLLLFDGSVSLAGVTSLAGVNSIKNIAASKAAALTGAPKESLDFTFTNTYTQATGRVAVSPKKGIDTVASLVNPIGAGIGWDMAFPDAVETYIINNLNHTFFFAWFSTMTRQAQATSIRLFVGNGANDNYLTQLGEGFYLPTVASGKGKLENNHPETTVLNVPQYKRTAVAGFTGATPNLGRSSFRSGRFAPFDQSNTGSTRSQADYLLYVEDLTVSGKTPQQADAILQAHFTKQFAIGGAFYGDTLQSPTILA